MLRTHSGKFAFVAGAFALFGGCQIIGPVAIDQGRGSYNNIIQSTSKEQTFTNIIRVYHHEPTSFMDVTEVDATSTFSGTVNGGVSGIGARAGTTGGTLAGQVESVAGGVTYSESPLIRYQPILGQALVAQLVTPVSPGSLESLFVSSWNVTPLIDFSTAYLTLDFTEFYSALNAIAELYYDNVIALIATKSDLTKEQDPTKDNQDSGTVRKPIPKTPNQNRGHINSNTTGQTQKITLEVTNKAMSSTSITDTLVIYLNPFQLNGPENLNQHRRDLQLWARLLWLYFGTQKNSPARPDNCGRYGKYQYTEAGLKNLDRDLERKLPGLDLNAIRKCLPNFIELRTMPVKIPVSVAAGLSSGAPLLRTFSALGILKNATEAPYRRIAFIDAGDYLRIRSYPWNRDAGNFSFYTLTSDDTKNSGDFPYELGGSKNDIQAANEAIDWLSSSNNGEKPFVYEPMNRDAYGYDYSRGNRALGLLRRYVLIIHGDSLPKNAYVAHFDRGEWFYIANDDEISQKNFDLISLFMTMMAVPSTTTPVGTSISVGGGG